MVCRFPDLALSGFRISGMRAGAFYEICSLSYNNTLPYVLPIYRFSDGYWINLKSCGEIDVKVRSL